MGAQLDEVQELETRVTNVFSVDVEDYFHVEAFSDIVPRERWDRYPLRVEDNTRRILDLLDQQEVEATFFVLGWVAERRAFFGVLPPGSPGGLPGRLIRRLCGGSG